MLYITEITIIIIIKNIKLIRNITTGVLKNNNNINLLEI
jgi:hypothetical protein